jgi:16S rRNA (cytosine1402-N4)-methyltransferase
MFPVEHQPVLLAEVMAYLKCEPGRIYVDATVGRAGHSREILQRSSPAGKLIGLDWDERAVDQAKQALAVFGNRAELRRENFKNLGKVLDSMAIRRVDGILADLGLSSEQLEDRERGFSFRWEAPLDMRMSRETNRTAQDLLADLSEKDIAGILRDYSEERWAARIARAIVRRRRLRPVRSTGELVETIVRSVPIRRGRIHPATRSFQALRIAVNDELNNLSSFLLQCEDRLNPGGRLGVISFHSLEDRIVKNQFRRWARGEDDRPPGFRILTPKPVAPSKQEVQSNPRARSAKLRVIEKLLQNVPGGQNGGSDL